MRDLDRSRARRHGVLAAGIAVVGRVAGCTAGGEPVTPVASVDRQAQVAARGQSVMPFDLDATTHHFTKTGGGGVQTVVADDPQDSSQVALIRQHLQQEADRFRRGDFTDPATIHGDRMPGLAVLRESPGKVTVEYAPTGSDALITYVSGETAVVAALHAWFDAQVGDHGAHATPGAPAAANPSPVARSSMAVTEVIRRAPAAAHACGTSRGGARPEPGFRPRMPVTTAC